MSSHNIFVGGAATQNYGQAMFPSAPANVPIADHKMPSTGGLQRDLDFVNSRALSHYARTHKFANGDILNAILLPRFSLVHAIFVEVVNPGATGLTCSILLTEEANGVVDNDNVAEGTCVVVAPGYKLDEPSNLESQSMYLPASDTAFAKTTGFFAATAGVWGTDDDSQYLQVKLAGVPADGSLGDLHLRIVVMVTDFNRYGQF
jgi:hypothetical protein